MKKLTVRTRDGSETFSAATYDAAGGLLRVYGEESAIFAPGEWLYAVERHGEQSDAPPIAPVEPPDSVAQSFDLSRWKLTLPVAKRGSSSALEIFPPELETYSSDYFAHDDLDYTFQVATGSQDSATTPNTKYLRSELRELYNWSPGEQDSTANWKPAGRHVLECSCKVLEARDDDPQIVIGQIHAAEAKPLVKLQFDGWEKPIRAIVNRHPEDGDPFSVTFDGELGRDSLAYHLEVSGDDVRLTVGDTDRHLTIGQELSSAWRDKSFYFRCGCYPQADKSVPGVYAVEFYAITLSHT